MEYSKLTGEEEFVLNVRNASLNTNKNTRYKERDELCSQPGMNPSCSVGCKCNRCFVRLSVVEKAVTSPKATSSVGTVELARL